MMRELIVKYEETGEYNVIQNEDPFFDEKELFLFGKTQVKLKKLLEEEFDERLTLMGEEDEVIGRM
jgi:hypothetical protein